MSRHSNHLGTDGTSFQPPSTAAHIQPEFGLNLPVPSSSWSTPASSLASLDPCNGPLATVRSSSLFCPSGGSGVVGLLPQLLGQSGHLWNGSRVLVSGQRFFYTLTYSSHWLIPRTGSSECPLVLLNCCSLCHLRTFAPTLASAWKVLFCDVLMLSRIADSHPLAALLRLLKRSGLLLLLQDHTFPSWSSPQSFTMSLCWPVDWCQPHPLASEPCFVTSQVLPGRILIWGKSFDLADMVFLIKWNHEVSSRGL